MGSSALVFPVGHGNDTVLLQTKVKITQLLPDVWSDAMEQSGSSDDCGMVTQQKLRWPSIRGTPDGWAPTGLERWSQDAVFNRSGRVSHRREKSSRSPLWSGEGGAHFVPGEAFSLLSLKLQCPSQLGFPAVAPGAPLPLSIPWVLSRERWHLPLALPAPLAWPLLASGSETCPHWGLGVGQTQDQAKGWWSWLTPSLD